MANKVVSNTFQTGLEQQNTDLFSANILKSKSLYFPSTHAEIEVVNNKAANATLQWKLLMLMFSGVDINSGIIVAIHLA